MMKLNFEFTKILTDYCVKTNTKMIYSSSAANYGDNGKYPSNLYGWSKYVAEKYVISNNGIALRYFNVYGPGEEHKGRMSSVAYQSFIKHRKHEECKLFPLKPKRDFIYVKDVVNANLYAEDNYVKLKGKFYDVGYGESRTFEDILDIMDIPFTYHEENKIPFGYQFYTCSNKILWMDGWEPKYNLENGLGEYKKYLQSIISL
jgi:ADP-L-glycero-D-manno-heptose 6-epimerase